MKKSLVVSVAIALCFVLSAVAQAEEPKAKSRSCEYTGIIKELLDNPERISVEVQGGDRKIFYFQKKEAKKECNSWQELTIENRVMVICKEKRGRLEATCVKKEPTAPCLSGASISGGTLR